LRRSEQEKSGREAKFCDKEQLVDLGEDDKGNPENVKLEGIYTASWEKKD